MRAVIMNQIVLVTVFAAIYFIDAAVSQG